LLVERRHISEKEKEDILNRHGRRCFVTGDMIGQDENVQFHHIKPYSQIELTHIDNIAPVCEEHHKHLDTLSLQEFRDKLELEYFFKNAKQRRLDDVLKEKAGTYGQRVACKLVDDLSKIKSLPPARASHIQSRCYRPAVRCRYRVSSPVKGLSQTGLGLPTQTHTEPVWAHHTGMTPDDVEYANLFRCGNRRSPDKADATDLRLWAAKCHLLSGSDAGWRKG
jgi:hypothetical protein